MENAHRKNSNRLNLNHFIRILCVFLFFLSALLTGGCEEEMAVDNNQQPTVIGAENKSLYASAMQIIQQSLTDKNPMVRTNAIEVVAKTRLSRLLPNVQRLYQDASMPVRFATAVAIGEMEFMFGKSAVETLLKDENMNVPIAAAFAMVKLGQTEYLEVLRKALANNDQTLRANAAMLIGKLKRPGDEDILRQLWWVMQDSYSDDKTAFQAAESIAMLGDERIYPKLWSMLISTYADDRVIGVRAMGALGTPDARNALLKMLEDKVPEVRIAAAEQLGRFNDKSGESEVLTVFKNNLIDNMSGLEQERIKVFATLAIGQIATPELTQFLPALLKDPSPFVRIAAAKAVIQSIGGGL